MECTEGLQMKEINLQQFLSK